MLKYLISSLLAALLIGIAFVNTPSAHALATSTNFPINILVFVPCASHGQGEVVALSGNLHDLFAVTFDNSGGGHVKFQDNPQGVTGIGQTTGAKYQGTGVTESTFTAKVGQTFTFVNNFRIIGQGTGNNFIVHENAHITVNPSGTVTASFDNFSAECM